MKIYAVLFRLLVWKKKGNILFYWDRYLIQKGYLG